MNTKNMLGSEEAEQIAVVQWAQYNTDRYPELRWLHHCSNGGSRHKQEAVKVIEEYLQLARSFRFAIDGEAVNRQMSIPNNSILKNGKIRKE